MLDEMAATNPEGYKKFIKKQMTEGVEVLKPPQPVMALHCKTAEVSMQRIVEPVYCGHLWDLMYSGTCLMWSPVGPHVQWNLSTVVTYGTSCRVEPV